MTQPKAKYVVYCGAVRTYHATLEEALEQMKTYRVSLGAAAPDIEVREREE